MGIVCLKFCVPSAHHIPEGVLAWLFVGMVRTSFTWSLRCLHDDCEEFFSFPFGLHGSFLEQKRKLWSIYQWVANHRWEIDYTLPHVFYFSLLRILYPHRLPLSMDWLSQHYVKINIIPNHVAYD
jgi:hypothetical protein